MHSVRTSVVYIQGINPECPWSVPKFHRLSHMHVPSSHLGFIAIQNLQEKHFPDWSSCMHPPLHDLSEWERSCYSQRSSMEDTHSCPYSPQITTWSVIITLSSNPLLWGDFLILETASSSYHWSLLTLHQQRSQFHRSTLQSSRPQLQNCPCL